MRYWDTDIINTLSGQERKKFLSKRQIIKYIYRHGTLTSAELVQLIQLSTPTTLLYLNELVDEGYIENRGKGESIGGRRPNTFGLVKNAVYSVGVEIGRKGIKLGLFNNELEKTAYSFYETNAIPDTADSVDDISNKILELVATAGLDFSKIVGVGISMPGLIDSQTGINYTYMNFGDKPLIDLFSERLRCPVVLENDAKSRTLAEMKFGAAYQVPNAMFVLIEWGLGLGLILDGRLYMGENGFSGEFSHIPIDADGVLCNCGKIGCLETLASGQALVRQTLEALESGASSLLGADFKQDARLITPSKIIAAAKSGDALAISQITKIGSALGKGVSYLIQILNPGVVILGGSVASANELITTPLKQSLFQYCLPQLRENVEVRMSPLDADANVMGAAAMLLEKALTS